MVPLEEWRARHQRGSVDPYGHHHLYGWTPLQLSGLLGEAGFAVREARVRSHLLFRYWWVLWQYRWFPRPVIHALARFWSGVRRVREVVAVAEAV